MDPDQTVDDEYEHDSDLLLGTVCVVIACCVVLLRRGIDVGRVDLRRGREWLGQFTRNRQNFGFYYTRVPLLLTEDDEDNIFGLPANRVGTFRNFFRLTRAEFNMLLEKVKPRIEKQDTALRDAISAEQRLMVSF